MTPERRCYWILAGGVIAWVVCAVILWLGGAPLGDNEALYARAAQLVIDGEPSRWNYLSKGMTAIASVGVLAGESERALRFLPMVLGLTFLFAAAMFARRTTNKEVAGWLVCVIAASWSIAKRSAELLSDLPAAACLLAGFAILITELEREDGPSRRLLLVAPLFAAAMYVRYGSCIPIAIASVVAVGFGWRAIIRRPGTVVATVVVFVGLMIPHALDANATTGSPLGFLLEGRDVLRTEYRGVGLVGFVSQNPFLYYGIATTPLLILGLFSIVFRRDRRTVMLWLIAVGVIVTIGMTTVAESRYIFVPIVLLLLLGIDVVYRWITTRREPLRRTAGYGAALVVVASWVFGVVLASRVGRVRARWDGLLTAATVIRNDSAGRRCQVVARHTSQMEWYSGCEALLEIPADPSVRVYVAQDGFGDGQPSVTGLRATTLIDQGGVVVVRLER